MNNKRRLYKSVCFIQETNDKFNNQMNELRNKMQNKYETDLNKLKMEKQKLDASHKEQIEQIDNNYDEKIKVCVEYICFIDN